MEEMQGLWQTEVFWGKGPWMPLKQYLSVLPAHWNHMGEIQKILMAWIQPPGVFSCFFFFLTSLLEYNCFTMVCQLLWYNKVNQLYIYIYSHISSLLHLPPNLPIPPLQVVTKHRADLPVLCGCFPLAIYFTFGNGYMSIPLSHFVPTYSSPSSCPQVHSLHLHLYSCPVPRFFRTFFLLDSIYMCQHTVFVFLFLTCFTLYDSLQVHPPHYK